MLLAAFGVAAQVPVRVPVEINGAVDNAAVEGGQTAAQAAAAFCSSRNVVPLPVCVANLTTELGALLPRQRHGRRRVLLGWLF